MRGNVWFDIDVANGITCDRLDTSQCDYRWLVNTLQWLHFLVLASYRRCARVMVALCTFGFDFPVSPMSDWMGQNPSIAECS